MQRTMRRFGCQLCASVGRYPFRSRLPTERGIRNQQYIVASRHFEVDVGRPVGEKHLIGIVDVYHDGVGHDVLVHRGVEPNLKHHSFELPISVGIDLEGDILAGMNLRDIGFADARPDLHPLQVLGDEKQAWALNDDTTVWPMFTRRSMMVPVTGDLMMQ